MTATIRTVLESLVSPDSLLPEPESERFRTGPGKRGLPAAVLTPATEEELAALLSRASEEGWRVLPAGLGLWLEGGGPTEVQLVVSIRRMTQVHEYNPPDLTFTAGAGLTLSALREITQPHGQWLPLNPPGGWEGSLGGALATGVGGSLRHLYGTARDHVLGLTLVAGDGRILRWGGKVVKNVAGFDVTRLCLGSWGSLGLITSVSARLFPIPEMDVTLVFRGPDASVLLPSARAMALSSLPLASVELLDSLSLEGAGAGESAALVLRILGSREQVESMVARVRGELSREVGNPQILENEESRSFHRNLDSWEAGAALVLRLSALPSETGHLAGRGRGTPRAAFRGKASRCRCPGICQRSSGVLRVAAFGQQGAIGSLASWISTSGRSQGKAGIGWRIPHHQLRSGRPHERGGCMGHEGWRVGNHVGAEGRVRPGRYPGSGAPWSMNRPVDGRHRGSAGMSLDRGILRILRPSDGTLVGELAVTPIHDVSNRVARTRSVQAGGRPFRPRTGNAACGPYWMRFWDVARRLKTPSWLRPVSPGPRPSWRWWRRRIISSTTSRPPLPSFGQRRSPWAG